jgi:hypothetical protein
MSKIVEAVNVMASNKDKIDLVIRGEYEPEIFFRYANKHKWSIIEGDTGVYYLNYYHCNDSLEEMASWGGEMWSDFNGMVSYNSKDLGTKEALESLKELYSVVKEKIYGMDDVLQDIISSDVNW